MQECGLGSVPLSGLSSRSNSPGGEFQRRFTLASEGFESPLGYRVGEGGKAPVCEVDVVCTTGECGFTLPLSLYEDGSYSMQNTGFVIRDSSHASVGGRDSLVEGWISFSLGQSRVMHTRHNGQGGAADG